jgi:hypothetical protein
VRYLTVPTGGTGMVDGASIVRLDAEGTRGMFAAMTDDRLEQWLERHDVDRLPGRAAVS